MGRIVLANSRFQISGSLISKGLLKAHPASLLHAMKQFPANVIAGAMIRGVGVGIMYSIRVYRIGAPPHYLYGRLV